MKKKEQNQASVSSTSMGNIPMGTVVAFMLNSNNIPMGWLPCNGTEIPSKYQELITALGSVTTPNLSGRTPIGTGTTTDANGFPLTVSLNDTGGEFTHKLTEAEMPSHQHFGWGEHGQGNWGTGLSNQNVYTGSQKTDTDNNLYGSTFTGGTYDSESSQISTSNGTTHTAKGNVEAHNVVQPYYVVNFIIYTGEDS
jgi:microcystin-dependent protein